MYPSARGQGTGISIPVHLLAAISSIESGQYDTSRKVYLPWPWTVNAAGRGYHLDTKQQAIDTVKKLRKQYAHNIAVGCMQINISSNKQAFANIEDAFDPEHKRHLRRPNAER